MRQVVSSVDGSKATPVRDIPADMLKLTLDSHLSLITKIINLWFENGYFPDDLKLAILASGKTLLPDFLKAQY